MSFTRTLLGSGTTKQNVVAWAAAGCLAYVLWVRPVKEEQKAVKFEAEGRRRTRGDD
jgi:hypothetical protein